MKIKTVKASELGPGLNLSPRHHLHKELEQVRIRRQIAQYAKRIERLTRRLHALEDQNG